MSLLIWLFSSIFQICNHTGPISHRSCSKVNRICTGLRGKIDSQADWNQHAPNLHHFFGEPVRLRTAFAPKSTGSAPVCGAKLILRLTGTNVHRICTAFASKPSGLAPLQPESGADLHRRALCPDRSRVSTVFQQWNARTVPAFLTRKVVKIV
jgi:hypothetical protein